MCVLDGTLAHVGAMKIHYEITQEFNCSWIFPGKGKVHLCHLLLYTPARVDLYVYSIHDEDAKMNVKDTY